LRIIRLLLEDVTTRQFVLRLKLMSHSRTLAAASKRKIKIKFTIFFSSRIL